MGNLLEAYRFEDDVIEVSFDAETAQDLLSQLEEGKLSCECDGSYDEGHWSYYTCNFHKLAEELQKALKEKKHIFKLQKLVRVEQG